jgi:succinyl-CoA synthetase alpha subunit
MAEARPEGRRRRQVSLRSPSSCRSTSTKHTKVITQGITGKTGQFHTEKCQEYANGKNCFVAGVNPKKAGESIFNIPIFASVKDAAQ